jgi:hypothetical protein
VILRRTRKKKAAATFFFGSVEHRLAASEFIIRSSASPQKMRKVFSKEALCSILTRDRLLRFGFFFIVLAVVFWGKNNLSDEARDDVTGLIIDRGFEATQAISDLMLRSKAWISFFEISSSWCIDILFLTMFGTWIWNGESFRLLVTYILFYGVRAFLQAVSVLPYPQGIIWIFPVAPSLVVPFGITSDFFPSGHVGFCIIAAAEFFKKKWYVLMVLAWIIAIYETIVMISARNHYTIDLVSGAIMAHYFHGWATILCSGFGKICIDRIVGPYLLYNWGRNPLNPECYQLPITARPDMSSPRATGPDDVVAQSSTEMKPVRVTSAPVNVV